MRILVTGADGQVGSALANEAAGHLMTRLNRAQLDITNNDAVVATVAAHRPDVIINAAAYTAVDAAETDEAHAFAVNAMGPELLANAARAAGAGFIHISTDYVFDGASSRAYREADPTAPQGAYGRTKRAGEMAVLAAHPAAHVVRTSWVYHHDGRNFVRTMVGLADRDAVRVVADQRGAPTYAPDLAAALVKLATAGKTSGKISGGILHLAAGGETCWADVAETIFADLRARGRSAPTVQRIATADWPSPARRPLYSTLDCSLAATAYGLALPDWQDGLGRCLNRLLGERASGMEAM